MNTPLNCGLARTRHAYSFPELFLVKLALSFFLNFPCVFQFSSDKFTGLELDALHSSIEALSARTKRYTHSLQADSPTQRTQRLMRRGNRVPDDGVSELKSLLEKLSLINSENSKKVKLVESALKAREITD